MSKLKQGIVLIATVLLSVIILCFAIWFLYALIHNNKVKNELITNQTTKNKTQIGRVDGFKRRTQQKMKCGKTVYTERIRNGNLTELFEFPWMALLAYQTGSSVVFMCAGTLITDQFVLTAAHCTNNKDTQLNFVRLGEHNLESDPDCEEKAPGEFDCAEDVQDIEIEEIIPHPDFNYKTFQNDISLIKLVKRANLRPDNVGTICLPLSKDLWDINLKNVTISGWGLTQHGAPSSVLLKTNLAVLPNEKCRVYKNINITSQQICVSGVKSSSCSGDSGGPLQMVAGEDLNYFQFGIISAGSLICSDNGLPGIHTKIFDYLDWIYQHVGDDLNL